MAYYRECPRCHNREGGYRIYQCKRCGKHWCYKDGVFSSSGCGARMGKCPNCRREKEASFFGDSFFKAGYIDGSRRRTKYSRSSAGSGLGWVAGIVVVALALGSGPRSEVDASEKATGQSTMMDSAASTSAAFSAELMNSPTGTDHGNAFSVMTDQLCFKVNLPLGSGADRLTSELQAPDMSIRWEPINIQLPVDANSAWGCFRRPESTLFVAGTYVMRIRVAGFGEQMLRTELF